ncbi:MAG: hypothetical protein QE271_03850 [Bacteriovoracaceae bacterium]|nr:hypothetical protein [Bacteriovoracaceae bacterium]
MRNFNHIAALIKRKRIAHSSNLSQSDLSSLLGYKNGQFISNVERSLCNIPFKMIKKVCQVLDISAEEIKAAMMKDHEETLNTYLLMDIAVHPSEDSNAPEKFPEVDFSAQESSTL